MRLKNDMMSYQLLFNTITDYYKAQGGRRFIIFEQQFPVDDSSEGYFVRYLIDSKHVVEYRIVIERNIFLGVLSLAIGPRYFLPGEFWDYDNSQRFQIEPSDDAIIFNLKLLEEFFKILD